MQASITVHDKGQKAVNPMSSKPNRRGSGKESQMNASTKATPIVTIRPTQPFHWRYRQAILLAALIVGWSSSLLAADPAPLLGDKDFYPSTERPVGEFGDGTANYPGAKGLVTEWDHRTGKNIIWKCQMPRRSSSSPIVVGRKVFVGSEPDELVCVDTDSGQILWKTSVMIDQFIPEADRAAVRTALGQVEDQVLAFDIPGVVAGQWVGAIAPLVDPAVSETAKKIDEIRKKVAAAGTDLEKREFGNEGARIPANLIVSKESADILMKHQITRHDKTNMQLLMTGIGLHAHMGFTMPTPVSDGKYVWYKSALGAMACLDLDGKVVWNKRIPSQGGTNKSFHGCGSPLLIGDRLFYQTNGQNIICVEKTTGKELWAWTYNGKTDGPGSQQRGHTSPSHLRVNGRDLIQTGIGPILDTVNGKVLERTGCLMVTAPARGVMVRDNVVIQRDGRGRQIGMRLQLEGDKVNQVALWAPYKPTNINYAAPVCCEHFLYYFNWPNSHMMSGHLSALRLDGKSPSADGQPPEPEVFRIPLPKRITWTVPDTLQTPTSAGKKTGTPFGWYYASPAVAEGYFFYGNDALGVTVVKLAGEKSAVVAQNFMDLGIRSTPFFQGNRMYVRSQHYLYCIGPAPVPAK